MSIADIMSDSEEYTATVEEMVEEAKERCKILGVEIDNLALHGELYHTQNNGDILLYYQLAGRFNPILYIGQSKCDWEDDKEMLKEEPPCTMAFIMSNIDEEEEFAEVSIEKIINSNGSTVLKVIN